MWQEEFFRFFFFYCASARRPQRGNVISGRSRDFQEIGERIISSCLTAFEKVGSFYYLLLLLFFPRCQAVSGF